MVCLNNSLAEREGFEPPEPRSSTVFKTAAIDHSAISPATKVLSFFFFAKYFSVTASDNGCKATNKKNASETKHSFRCDRESDSGAVRTRDPQLRRLLLYPTELRNRHFVKKHRKIRIIYRIRQTFLPNPNIKPIQQALWHTIRRSKIQIRRHLPQQPFQRNRGLSRNRTLAKAHSAPISPAHRMAIWL